MNNAVNGHLCIVFAQEHYNPLGIIRSLGENGVYPVYISVKRRGEVATKSIYISRLFRVNSIEEGYNLVLQEYGNFSYENRPFILFSDDKSIGYFDMHMDNVRNKFIVFNAGAAGNINKYMDKYLVSGIAERCGFNVIPSHVVRCGEIPGDLSYPVITKDISSNSGAWKSDVYICNCEEELMEAYQHIQSPTVLIQKFLDKKTEYALQGYAIDRGRQVHICTALTCKYPIRGYYSPYHEVTPFCDENMLHKLEAMFIEIGYEGIFEVEFLVGKDDEYYFLEVNLRTSCFGYTATVAGMPMPYLWIKGMLSGKIDPGDRKTFKNFDSMSEIIDYGKRVETGLVSLPHWIRDFKKAKCTFYYNEKDMQPFEYIMDKWEQYE